MPLDPEVSPSLQMRSPDDEDLEEHPLRYLKLELMSDKSKILR